MNGDVRDLEVPIKILLAAKSSRKKKKKGNKKRKTTIFQFLIIKVVGSLCFAVINTEMNCQNQCCHQASKLTKPALDKK